MKFTYVSRDVSFTTSMKEMVEEKLAKFDSYFRADSEVDAVITISILPQSSKGC